MSYSTHHWNPPSTSFCWVSPSYIWPISTHKLSFTFSLSLSQLLCHSFLYGFQGLYSDLPHPVLLPLVPAPSKSCKIPQCEWFRREKDSTSKWVQFFHGKLGGWPFLSSLRLFNLPLHWSWVWLPKVWKTWQAVPQICLETWFMCLTQVVSTFSIQLLASFPDSIFMEKQKGKKLSM